jgi:hypothetical protein
MSAGGNGSREERVVKNEVAFREHNARRADLEVEVLPDEETLLLVCECGDGGCVRAVEVTAAEYEWARARADQFIVLPGHVFPEYEDVIRESGRHAVVRKKP